MTPRCVPKMKTMSKDNSVLQERLRERELAVICVAENQHLESSLCDTLLHEEPFSSYIL